MTESTRAKAGRRPKRSASQLFIAALVVFGIAASVLLLFSENIQWLRVGLVSALWAAIVGAFAMTKYRREAVADQTRAKDLQTVYELQLAREISARREYELSVEARVRSEVQLDTNEVAALRAELAHLRNNLQVLFDGNLPTERVALRAEAVRMQEIGGGRNYDGYQPAPSGLYVPGRPGTEQNNGGQNGGQNSGGQGADRPSDAVVPGLATPYDEPVTAETSVLYPDVPIGDEIPAGYTPRTTARAAAPNEAVSNEAVSSEAVSSEAVSSEGASTQAPSHRPVPASFSGSDQRQQRRTPTPPRASFVPDNSRPDVAEREPVEEEAVAPSVSVAEPASSDSSPEQSTPVTDAVVVDDAVPVAEPDPAPEPEAAPDPEAAPEQEPAPESNQWDLPEPSPRRRRRAEPDATGTSGAHSNGRSVAEIMAGLQSGSTGTTERRHRRRAD
ncbi:MAG: DUF6779 domain-containing protein [Rhodococcus sp. (in: high G+C Gram-positive bacteria)]